MPTTTKEKKDTIGHVLEFYNHNNLNSNVLNSKVLNHLLVLVFKIIHSVKIHFEIYNFKSCIGI